MNYYTPFARPAMPDSSEGWIHAMPGAMIITRLSKRA